MSTTQEELLKLIEANYSPSKEVTSAKNAYTTLLANPVASWSQQANYQPVQAAKDAINNQAKFNYDLNADALYNQYKNQYMANGKLAMQDTMGQASALTGGYGNSYASTAGNQAYQSYLQNLNDVVPDLYQMAYDKYNQETSELYKKYSLATDEYNTKYGEYQDQVTNYNNRLSQLAENYSDAYTKDYNQYADKQSNLVSSYKAYLDSLGEDGGTTGGGTTGGDTTGGDTTGGDTHFNYSGWGANDWYNYFNAIRQTEGQAAAEKELSDLSQYGVIPKSMVASAAIGARGKASH